MQRSPLLLVAVALATALLTVGVALLASRPESGPPPLAAPALGRPPRPPEAPAPIRADPRQVAERLRGAALPPGDQVLADALLGALAAGEAPSYKSTVDAPLGDGAAQNVRDELSAWIHLKMAGLGFTQAVGRPTIGWHAHVDPLEGGRCAIHASVRSGGDRKFDQRFEVPAVDKPHRLDEVLGAAFAPASAPR